MQLAAAAEALFASDTASQQEKHAFERQNVWYLEAGVEGKWSDDLKETDLLALVVLDDVPHEVRSKGISTAHSFRNVSLKAQALTLTSPR